MQNPLGDPLVSQSRRQSTNHFHHRPSLSIASNTPLPPSPNLNSPRRVTDQQRFGTSPSAQRPPPSPLRRSSSTMSLSGRSASPALGRKASTSSMRNGESPATPRRAVSQMSMSRRASFNPVQSSPGFAPSPLAAQMEEKPPLKASDVAEEHFKKEMELHNGSPGAGGTDTIVIIHDQCYGHRFSRPKTGKADLSTIVERPERLLATALGVSVAYVRLGGRHAEGAHPPHPNRGPSKDIPFKIHKTARTVDITSTVVKNVHGTDWMDELRVMCDTAEKKLAANGKELVRTDGPKTSKFKKATFHPTDLYLCSESLNALQGALGGVFDGVDAVFKGTQTGTGPSRAFISVRPPGHHCSADFPSGFCWLNNVHVGIEHAAITHGLTHAAIIDFDLHHGDGSQEITWSHNAKLSKLPKNAPNSKRTSIGYFSLHDINSYPCEYGDDDKIQNASLCIENAHNQTIWNVHLQPWRTKPEFWQLYESRYQILIEKARAFLKQHTARLRALPSGAPQPMAAIFLSAGFDASEHESEGMQRHKVNVPTEFYARFTRDVVQMAQDEDTGTEGRVISVLEGGYSDRALCSGVLSHLSGLCDGQTTTYSQQQTNGTGLGYEMSQRMGNLNLLEEDIPLPSTEPNYDPSWWQESNLAELEALVNPPPVAPPKKPRTGAPPTYFSPTQSFSAKVVDPMKVHRSASGSKFMSASPSRAPSPPPPEVDWATAAHQLSKLLIPTDRQTKSCTAEDLSEPRVKKERQSIAPATLSVESAVGGRQLRGRKAKTPAYAEPDSDADNASLRSVSVSNANRRRTMADFTPASAEPAVSRPVSRRMSVASSIGSMNNERAASRAPSVVPSRKSSVAPAPPTNGVTVRKARVPSQAPTDAVKSGKVEPSMPRIPSNYLKAPQNKENEIDQITSGLQRVKLKMPTKEQHEAKEKQKALEAKKAAPKAPAARKPVTTRTKPATTVRKPATKGAKVPTGPSSPTDTSSVELGSITGTVSSPEAPLVQETANGAPLEQPQPLQLPKNVVSLPVIPRSISDPIQPPTEPMQLDIEPDQLPKNNFTTIAQPISLTTSPPRPDTPPPPPPPKLPQFNEFIQYAHPQQANSVTSNAVSGQSHQLQWQPPNSDLGFPVGPVSPPRMALRKELPVFSANGMIPFAPNPHQAGMHEQGKSMRNGQVEVKTDPTVKKDQDIWEVPETPAK